jgi:hypothetical protein
MPKREEPSLRAARAAGRRTQHELDFDSQSRLGWKDRPAEGVDVDQWMNREGAEGVERRSPGGDLRHTTGVADRVLSCHCF